MELPEWALALAADCSKDEYANFERHCLSPTRDMGTTNPNEDKTYSAAGSLGESASDVDALLYAIGEVVSSGAARRLVGMARARLADLANDIECVVTVAFEDQ